MRRIYPVHICAIAVTLAAMLVATQYEAAAQRGRGGGAAASRSYSSTASASRTTVNRNVQVNQNVNVNRNVNVDVDNRDVYHPVARTAAAVAVTAAAVGTVAYSIPPSCVPVVVSGVTYQQCGSTWYQPQFAGTSVTYVVANPPQ